MTGKKTTWARVQMLVIAAVFLGPLLVATWMYYSGALQPQGRVNKGALIDPIVSLRNSVSVTYLQQQLEGRWALIYVNRGECGDACREALYTQRQSRLMLGREMERLIRIFLHGETPPDTVFLAAKHAGLVAASDSELAAALEQRQPVALADGGYFLLDPLGNLVMYFEPAMNPRDIVDDITRLLKLSHIG